jgi:alpha-tubulin suppressor-like RCC1 family protein
MKPRHSIGRCVKAAMVALVLGATSLMACESQQEAKLDQSSAEDSVTIALTSVPASTLCIRATATPASGPDTVRSFIVTPGSTSANLKLGALVPGAYTLNADAFNVACTSISGAGSWIADPVAITVRAGVPTSVTMTFRKNAPVEINANFVNNVKAVAVGQTSSYIVTDSGVLQTGTINETSVFTRTNFAAFDSTSVPGNAVVTIAPTWGGACALRVDGTVWCWGTNGLGELGPGIGISQKSATPVQVTGLSNVYLLAAGPTHVCASRNNGSSYTELLCWGSNSHGQLGNGTTDDSATPVYVYGTPSPSAHRMLAAGNETSYAVLSIGYVEAWGANQYGQLGDGTTTDQPRPNPLANLHQAAMSVSAGSAFACALVSTGEVLCWGHNLAGQLGDGTTTNRLDPTLVLGLTATQIASTQLSSCALTTSGGTVCWGANPLGDGSNDNSSVIRPVKLNGISLTSLASSGRSSSVCGISSTLDVYCWGNNSHGQLGDGGYNSAFSPVQSRLQ